MEELSKFCYSTTTTTTTTSTPTSIITTTTTTTTTTITHFSTLLLSDFLFFLSFIFSHPLYFSYFIFFSPYILKLLSFLSPLFITTSLFLLAFLTVTPALVGKESSPQISESKAGFLLNVYQTVLKTLRSRLDDHQTDEFRPFEELEACILLVVDDYPIIDQVSKTEVEIYDTQIVKFWNTDQDLAAAYESTEFQGGLLQAASGVLCDQLVLIHNVGEDHQINDSTTDDTKSDNVDNEEKPPSIFDSSTGSDETTTLTKICSENNGGGGGGDQYTSNKDLIRKSSGSTSLLRMCPEAEAEAEAAAAAGILFLYNDNGGDQYISKAKDHQADVKKNLVVGSSNYNLQVCGSMRKVEKEWKRTLACKLYEERQNVDGSEEGMDSLWEANYESDDSGKKMKKKKNKKKDHQIIKTTNLAKEKSDHGNDHHENQEEEEDDEDMDHVQMCCLQALKFSTGKMNLGMGKLRISKAFKGIGWFNNVSRRAGKRT